MKRSLKPRVALLIAVWFAGCSGQITTPPEQLPNVVGPRPEPELPAVASPLTRMTGTQYNNTLRDLFAPIVVPAQTVPPDVSIESYDNNAGAQTPSAALIEAYQSGAESVASAAMASPAALLGCTPNGRASEDACAVSFFARFVPSAFRRRATATELAGLESFYALARADGADFATAITLSLEAILQAPAFLYRVEVGVPVEGRTHVVRLGPFELASRLSYFLWNTMPDPVLFAAAESGALASNAGIEAQAERMLADPRARTAVANFHRQWLQFERMKGMTKDPTMFPKFNVATVGALEASAEKYVDGLFFAGGTFKGLLTDDRAWVNDDLAQIYGVASPGPTLSLVAVDRTQRSGILTNAGLMAAFAHQTADSPVQRGVFVLTSLLCSGLPPPPPGVNLSPPSPTSNAPLTTRDRFEQQHEQGSCASCHRAIDGIGFGFEYYDASGRWRAEEAGLPINAKGWFTGTKDPLLTGSFDGAVELGQRLADSKVAQTCLVKNWLRYALGVDHSGIDAKGLQPIFTAFTASNFQMRALVVAITTSEAFQTRVVGAAP